MTQEPITSPNAKSKASEPQSSLEIKAWRIAFKVTALSYDFSQYDEIDINSDDYLLFEPEVFGGNNKFYDLCRIKGRYKQFHEDFAQTYFFKLFANTPFPCNIFVFIEEVLISQGQFVKAPHALTIDTRNIKSKKHSFFGKNKTPKATKVEADYEIFFINSPQLGVDKGSLNANFAKIRETYL